MAFQLFTVDVVKLLDYLNQPTFHRIEVSNICDRGYVSADRTLRTFSPMLKPKAENPQATLLMLFLNAVREAESEFIPDISRVVQPRKFESSVDVSVFDILPGGASALTSEQPLSMAGFSRLSSVLSIFGNFDCFFNIFLARPDPYKAGSMNTLTRAHGMKVKMQHTIIEPGPFQITDSTTKAEFQIMISQSTTGHECYMEFEKSD